MWATLRLVPHGTVTIWSSVFLYLPVSTITAPRLARRETRGDEKQAELQVRGPGLCPSGWPTLGREAFLFNTKDWGLRPGPSCADARLWVGA